MNIKPVTFLYKILLPLICFFSSTALLAEDIDLFVGRNASTDPATVMLAWHTSGNISSNADSHNCRYIDENGNPTSEPISLGDKNVAGMEQCAIVNALQTLKNNRVLLGTLKVGLMTFNDNQTGVGDGCGYLLVKPILLDEVGVDKFIQTMKDLKRVPGNQSALGDMVAEVWAALNGFSKSCSGVDYSDLANDLTNCSNAVMIYIGNAVNSAASVKDGNAKPSAGELLEAEIKKFYVEGSDQYNEFATIRNGNGFNFNPAVSYYGDEWSRFMRYVNVDDSAQADRNITTYVLAVYAEGKNNSGEVAFYKDMAAVGGGETYLIKSTESDAFSRALGEILNEVQDVNSVFSSATLPVSANTQGTYENQIYIAMFRPDPSGGPRWLGNLKQFQFGTDSGGSIVLTDADDTTTNSNSIVNAITGGLVDDAVSFWTTNTPGVTNWPTSPNGFWKNSPEGDGGALDSPDGDLVQKGGAGQMLRVDYLTSSTARRVYTNKCASGACGTNGLANFNTSNMALKSYFDDKLSSVSSPDSATITAGAYGTANGSIACTKINGNRWDCVYSLSGESIVGGASKFNFNVDYDQVVLGSGVPGSGDCTVSQPCAIISGGASTFAVSFKNDLAIKTFSAKPITKLSQLVKVQQSSHGIASGVTNALKTLENCVATGISDSTTIYNGNKITGVAVALDSGTFVDSSNFTGRVKANGNSYNYFLATSLAKIQCGSSGDTLTSANLISWIRGDDIAGNEAMVGPCPLSSRSSTCPISIRGSVHGDVLHSRPAVINYGEDDGEIETTTDVGVVVYYGSNDGHFRAVNGNKTESITIDGVTVRPGGELWSFIAEDFLDQFPRLFRDSPAILFPTTLETSGAKKRDYFFDGTTTFFQDNRSTGTTKGNKYIYLTSRRGGRFIYALDVTLPMSPKVMWKFDAKVVKELGYTWSQPKVTKIGGRDRPVLVFGAGNSPEQDADPVTVDDSMGRGLFILDGITGKIIWAALNKCDGTFGLLSTNLVEGVAGKCVVNPDLSSAFSADITVLDSSADGYTDRLYASDVGGNIWRVDLYTTVDTDGVSTQNIGISKFAELAEAGNGKRKFLYGVDVIPIFDGRDLVVAVSGDREHPLYSDDATLGTAQNVQNRFYMLIDVNTSPMEIKTTTIKNDELLDQTDASANCFDTNSADNAPISCGGANTERYIFDGRITKKRGYFIDLAVGEKGVNAPLTEAGTVYFGTNQPDTRTDNTSCKSGLGRAFAYQVDLFSGSRTVKEYSGGGLPPSPISGLVNINDEIRFFIMGGDGDSIYKPSNGKVINSGRKRMYYYYK